MGGSERAHCICGDTWEEGGALGHESSHERDGAEQFRERPHEQRAERDAGQCAQSDRGERMSPDTRSNRGRFAEIITEPLDRRRQELDR